MSKALTETRHVPIMVSEVLEYLRTETPGKFLDCTLGGAGHTQAILDSNRENFVVGADRDANALNRAATLVQKAAGRVRLVHCSFAELSAKNTGESFDGILADLGVSTDQLFEERGFSFHDDSPLDMRMDCSSGFSADYFVNSAPETELNRILREGGVGTEAGRIAKAIIRNRPIEKTSTLASIVSAAAKSRKSHLHPATLSFQAIRMAVNAELEQLQDLLNQVPKLAKPGGRFAAISFHSLEDKLVARGMRRWQTPHEWSASWAGNQAAASSPSIGRVLTPKAIRPSAEEIARNPSARSARLRVFEFC